MADAEDSVGQQADEGGRYDFLRTASESIAGKLVHKLIVKILDLHDVRVSDGTFTVTTTDLGGGKRGLDVNAPGGAGGGPATIADGADVAEGSTTDAAVVTDTSGTVSGKLRGIVKFLYERMPTSLGQKTKAGSLAVVLASDQDALQVVGNVAHDAVDSGNPVKVGGKAYTSDFTPAAVTSGDRADLQLDLFGRARVVLGRLKLLGSYKAASGLLTILATAHATTAGFFWLQNPVGSGIIVAVKKFTFVWSPAAATVFASAPSLVAERMTFTGTASGAQITPAKRDSSDAAAVATVRTASTGMTLANVAAFFGFLVGAVMTAVASFSSTTYDWEPTDEDDRIILRAGEALQLRQNVNGSTSDTRKVICNLEWEEFQ